MGACDAPGGDDLPRITVAEWERLNRSPRREALLRYHWRTFRFLRTSAPVSELQGRQQAFRNAVVATVAFNRPDVIEWQIHLVRRSEKWGSSRRLDLMFTSQKPHSA